MEVARVQTSTFALVSALSAVLLGCGTPPAPRAAGGASGSPSGASSSSSAGATAVAEAAPAPSLPDAASPAGEFEAPDAARSDGGADEACPAPSETLLAWLSCDGTRIDVRHPIELHPARAHPSEPTRAVLAAVGELLRQRQDVLLVRIEVVAAQPSTGGAQGQREQMAKAQARADALLQHLWRRQRVSAERLEAVGYPHDPARPATKQAWSVALRVVQRAPR